MNYKSRTVFVPAHYRTIDFYDFGQSRKWNVLDAVEHLKLFWEIYYDEKSSQFGLLLMADFGTYIAERKFVNCNGELQTSHHMERITERIFSWNINYFNDPKETLMETVERIVSKFNTEHKTNIQF